MVRLHWNDNSDFEKGYVVEKSTEAQGEGFSVLARLPENSTEFSEETIQGARYRVYAVRGNKKSSAAERCLFFQDRDGDGYGVWPGTYEACPGPDSLLLVGGDCKDSDSDVFPGNPEKCDGKDNDCDASVDEGCACTDGLIQSCYSGASETKGTGVCKAGSQTCSGGQWGTCSGEVIPVAEICDGKDNDCDGQTDNACDTTPPTFAGLSSATGVSRSQIDLAWAAATDNVSAPANIIYRICQSNTSGTCGRSFTATYTTAAGATSHRATGYTAGATYYFVARAVDEKGNEDPNTTEKSAMTLPLPWTAQTSGTSEGIESVNFPVDATTGYAVGPSNAILKTTDGGTTWTQTSGTGFYLYGIHFPVDTTTGYAVGVGGTILKTTNGGATWTAQTSGTSSNLSAVHFPVDVTTGYAVGGNGTILKTTNGGANWVAQTSGTTNWLYTVHFPVDATTGYAVGDSGKILKTTDGGATWTAQTSGTSNHLYAVHFPVDATTGYAVGLGGTILKTTTGGQ
ncbi:MAG: hypothetical protein HYT87_14815 [Nitrospirae bacterium]|nr:hypothetical protein [Nitrospirota bacterium]